MPEAETVPRTVPCNPYELPNGVGVIEIPYDGTEVGFWQAPGGLRYNGRVYGRSSHNSDTFRITYRTDKPCAFNL